MGDRRASPRASAFRANNRSPQARSFGSHYAVVGDAGVQNDSSHMGPRKFLPPRQGRRRQLPRRIVLSESWFLIYNVIDNSI